MTKTEFLLTNQYNIKHTRDENTEIYQLRELLLDLTPNSLKQRLKNYIGNTEQGKLLMRSGSGMGQDVKVFKNKSL